MARWQFKFEDSCLNRKYGPIFVGARRGSRGAWVQGADLPEHVREYLQIKNVSVNWFFNEPLADTATLRQNLHNAGEVLHWYKDANCKGLVEIADPKKRLEPRKIPRGVPAIRNLKELCEYFGADSPQRLNRRIYKDTDCGASISVETPDGTWHHNGEDWSGITEITGFTIQTIVEGSDAEVNSDTFALPVTHAEVEHWMSDMEDEADRLWHEANDEPELDNSPNTAIDANAKWSALNSAELATVLAALRYWQREGLMSAGCEQDIATDGGRLEPLTEGQIEALCERLNCGE